MSTLLYLFSEGLYSVTACVDQYRAGGLYDLPSENSVGRPVLKEKTSINVGFWYSGGALIKVKSNWCF